METGKPVSASHGDIATILFADIGSSVRLYQEVGDVAGHRFVSESLDRMATAIADEGGSLLRTVGDASLARFEDADAAFRAAVAIQQAHQDSPLSVRVGFHSGPVIEDKGDVYGNAVNIAARIASFARVNEITTSGGSVKNLSEAYRSHATLLKQSDIRGVEDTVDIFRINWQSDDRDAATRIATRIATPSEMQVPSIIHQLEITFNEQVWVLGSARTSLKIGRTEFTDICVVTDRASRDHAVLEYRAGQFTLTDTSTNGTYIRKDGQPTYIVQRETVILDGRGFIGVGVEPANSSATQLGSDAGDPGDAQSATIRFAVEFA